MKNVLYSNYTKPWRKGPICEKSLFYQLVRHWKLWDCRSIVGRRAEALCFQWGVDETLKIQRATNKLVQLHEWPNTSNQGALFCCFVFVLFHICSRECEIIYKVKKAEASRSSHRKPCTWKRLVSSPAFNSVTLWHHTTSPCHTFGIQGEELRRQELKRCMNLKISIIYWKCSYLSQIATVTRF